MRALLLIFVVYSTVGAADVQKVPLQAPPGMTRAELYIFAPMRTPVAILVLCPGMNGSAMNMVRDKTWQEYCRKNNFAMCGLSFASEPSTLFAGEGYTNVALGSGLALLEEIDARWPDTPLLLYGFSSGAFFVEEFVQWMPTRVAAWCAHATGRFEDSPREWPPGIVSCGELDASRFGPSLTHFKKGRSKNRPLLWVGLPETGHSWPESLHEFVRRYFKAVLFNDNTGIWVDIESEAPISAGQALQQPAMSGWIPSKDLLNLWRDVHQP